MVQVSTVSFQQREKRRSAVSRLKWQKMALERELDGVAGSQGCTGEETGLPLAGRSGVVVVRWRGSERGSAWAGNSSPGVAGRASGAEVLHEERFAAERERENVVHGGCGSCASRAANGAEVAVAF
jgi:hypothetical protein